MRQMTNAASVNAHQARSPPGLKRVNEWSVQHVKTLPDSLLEEVYCAMPVARLGVLDADSAIDVMPIVFATANERLYSPIDGKPKKSGRLRRLDSIALHPEAALTLDHYSGDWQSLWWIKLACEASVVTSDDGEFKAAEAALRTKYAQYQTTPLFKGEPTLIRFKVRTVKWWASSGEAGLRRWLKQAPADTVR